MKYSKLRPDFFQQGGYSPVQFSSSQFIPVYAGAPIAEAQRNAEQTAGIYHQNLADLTKLDIMNANRKVLDSAGDQAANEKVNQRLAEQFKNITAKGDLENQTLQVNALLREYMNDPAVKALTESRANADRERAFQEEARSKGATIVLDNPAEGHQTIQYDEKGKPVYNIYKGTGQIKLDWQGKKAKIADELKANAGPLSAADVAKSSSGIRGYIETGRWEGLSTDKVGKQLTNMMTAYQGTQEYNQEKAVALRDLMQQQPGLSAEDYDAAAEKSIRERMLSEGLLRTYSKTDRDFLTDWMLKDAMDAAKQNPPPGAWATGATSAVTNPLVEPLTTLLDSVDENTGQVAQTAAVILKKDGKTYSEQESQDMYTNAIKFAPDNPYAWLEQGGFEVTKRTKEQVKQQNSEVDELLKNTLLSTARLTQQNFDETAAESIRQEYPNLNAMPKELQRKALVKIQKEAVQNRANVTTPQILQTREEVVDEGKMLNYVNNIASVSGNELAIAVPKELGGGSYKDLNGWNGVQEALLKIAEKNGLNTDKKLSITGSKQGMSTGNPYGIAGAANTVITVTDESGKSISVPMMAAPNKQLQAVMAPLNNAWMKANNGKFGEQSVYWPKFKENFTVENYPTHENGTWETKSRIKLPDEIAAAYGQDYVDMDTFQAIWYELDRGTIDQYKNTFIQ